MKPILFRSILLISLCGCDVPQSTSSLGAESGAGAGSTSSGYVVAVTDVRSEEGYIIGHLENKTEHDGYFKIQFKLLDESGAVVGNAVDLLSGGLAKGQKWRFKAFAGRDARVFQFDGVWCKWGQVKASYELRNISSAEAGQPAANTAEAINKRYYEEQPQRGREEKLRAQQERARQIAAANAIAKQDLSKRVIAFQHQQASNGYGSFQYELGRRYLTADGVETNRALAIHWLKSACTNGLSEATNLLVRIQ